MPFVSDTFTDATGTTLAAHTGETGATWTVHPIYSATLSIDANQVKHVTTSTSTAYYASGVPATAEYDVSCVFSYTGSLVTGDQGGVIGRASTSAETFYIGRYNHGAGWELVKVLVGSFTVLQSSAATLTSGQGYTIRLEIRNAAKKVFIDGVERLVSSDNAITAAGRSGLRGRAAGAALNYRIDSFVAVDASEATGLSGSAASISGASGAVTTQIPLLGGAISVATGSGSVTTGIPITGSAIAQVTASGNIVTSITLGGAAISAATATAALAGGVAELAGSMQSASAASGNITTAIVLSGASIASALASADLTASGSGLSGSAAALAASSSVLITNIPLIGAAQAFSAGSANITTMIPLQGAMAQINNATGALTVSITLTSAAWVQAAANGSLTTLITLSGPALAQASANGALFDDSYQPGLARSRRVSGAYRERRVAA